MRRYGMLTRAALAILLVTASAEAFDVKTGLWQIDTTRETTGALPIPPAMLNKMTPEQREHFQAAGQAQMNNPMHSYQSCLTQKDLDEGFKPDRPECTSKVLSKSSTGREGADGLQERDGHYVHAYELAHPRSRARHRHDRNDDDRHRWPVNEEHREHEGEMAQRRL